MSKRIYLTQNKFTLVSDEDYEHLNQYNWCYHSGYVDRSSYKETGKHTKQQIHRQIIEKQINRKLNDKEIIDHVNGNKLDNRRINLRIANTASNGWNRKTGNNNTSGYKGVHYIPRINKWQSRIQVYKNRKHLGYFETAELAAKAYDNAAIEYHGEFANLNFSIS